MTHHTGLTVIEVAIVIALMSVASLYTITNNLSSLMRSEVVQERDTFIALVAHRARAAALNQHNGTAHGILIDITKRHYVIFSGPTYIPDSNTNVTIPFSTNSTNVTTTNGYLIIFPSRLSDATSSTTGVTFSGGDSRYTVEINAAGRINW